MKITSQILSLPPYISTTWANIASLHVSDSKSNPLLIVELVQGGQVEIPDLERSVINTIFATHAHVLESSTQSQQALSKQDPLSLAINLPLKMLGEGIDKMGAFLQHNPDASNTPEIPMEVVERISTFIQTLGLSENTAIPQPVDGCNCTFCQIARTIHNAMQPQPTDPLTMNADESVSEEDLRFRTWDIDQKGDRLYLVTNPIDHTESYNVYLGEPIGCTCGSRNCEHVRAVLSS